MAPLGGDFSAKVAQANDRIICGSSVDAVKTLPMGRILARRLRIPFFQRRYCWSEPQWATLLRDVEACGGAGHALGRLTCAVEADGRLLVIDGQPRPPTGALPRAAGRAAPAADGALHARINNVLFPDGGALAAWRASMVRRPEGRRRPVAAGRRRRRGPAAEELEARLLRREGLRLDHRECRLN